MNVSVIVPVYNAEAYLEKAVHSALDQPQTAEVILAEDGSRDGSLAICQKLADVCKRVKLLTHPVRSRHPDGGSHGAAATRNLALGAATAPFIAFLDADDFYLPYRFQQAERVFEEFENTKGVYEAVSTYFDNTETEASWRAAGRPLFTSIQQGISPDDLFENQAPVGRLGHCHLNGLVVRSEVFEKTGLFDPQVPLHEDSAFFMKLAAYNCLRPGNITEPVAMRRVHFDNRISSTRTCEEDWEKRRKMWLSVLRWMLQTKPDRYRERSALVISKLLWQLQLGSSESAHTKFRRYFDILRDYPALMFHPQFMKTAIKLIIRKKNEA